MGKKTMFGNQKIKNSFLFLITENKIFLKNIFYLFLLIFKGLLDEVIMQI